MEDEMKKLLVGVSVLVALVPIVLYLREPIAIGALSPSASQISPPKKPQLLWTDELENLSANIGEPHSVDNIDERDQANRVINIGEPIYPDDPSTWPIAESAEVISIGESIDPDDPSTWPKSYDVEFIDIGYLLDMDDLSAWPHPEDSKLISIGEFLSPDDLYNWSKSGEAEFTNVGEPIYPDDPFTWPQ